MSVDGPFAVQPELDSPCRKQCLTEQQRRYDNIKMRQSGLPPDDD